MRSLVALALLAATADASPNVSLDDPVYGELAATPVTGGVQPLTAARIHDLLGDPRFAPGDGWWVELDRVAAEAAFFHDAARPYSTPLRPRDMVGDVDIACERQEGRPCGNGANLMSEVDGSAGFGREASTAVRLRAQRTPQGLDLAVDRLYANAELGPVAAEIGRDVLVLGPSSRTQLGWGENAPPLDQLRLSTSHPLALTDDLRGSLLYVVGRLRDPQTYPGNLVTIARGQLDIANNFELGMMQLLQLGGDGAPGFTAWQFITEHVTRRDASATAADTSNRRIGFDMAARVAGLHGARFYYQIVFEDWRQQFADAVRYDADHLFGVEVARHGLTLEVLKTGGRSEEHTPRITGFTTAGRVPGAPLGPDALSVYASERRDLVWGSIAPWLEIARLSSDTYTFADSGNILHTSDGVAERRYRAGVQLQLPLRRELRLELDAVYEHVSAFAFDPTAHRDNVGATIAIVWTPRAGVR